MIWQVHIVEAHWLLCGVVDWLWRLCLNGSCTSLWGRVACSCSRMLNSSLKASTEFEFYNILVLSFEQSFLFVNNYNCLLWLEQHWRVCCAPSSVTANRCTAAWRMNSARWKGASDTAHFIMWIKATLMWDCFWIEEEKSQIQINIFIASEADQTFTSFWCYISALQWPTLFVWLSLSLLWGTRRVRLVITIKNIFLSIFYHIKYCSTCKEKSVSNEHANKMLSQ